MMEHSILEKLKIISFVLFHTKLSLCLGTIWFFGGIIIVFIIYPIVFNFFIIPKIEKRIGKKLEYGSVLYVLYSNYLYWFGGKDWIKYLDIVPYIAVKYLNWKLKLPLKIDPGCSLAKVDYKIERASDLEIFMGVFFVFFGIAVFVLAGMSVILRHYGY